MKTKHLINSLLSVTLISLLAQQPALAEIKQVGPIVWDTTSSTDIQTDNIADNMSQLVFVRFPDNLPNTTNVNLSIDNSYHISLGSNHLTKVLVCTGSHQLSTQTTAHKSNDLLNNAQTITTEPEQTYFYQVQANNQGDSRILPLAANTLIQGTPLLDYLNTTPKQTHQISRVVADCPPAPPPAPIVIVEPTPEPEPQPEPITFNKPIVLDVLFEFDSAVVVPQYYSRLAEMAQFINDNNASALIEGHTDAKGDNAYNMTLSEQRAAAVKQLLIDKYSVNPNKLNTQGFGETRPIAPNTTDEGRQQNRRVVAIVLR